MKLKVEMCAKRDFIKKYINIDEEYVWAEIKGGGYTKFNIKIVDQATLSRQDYVMRCSFIVETCLFDSCTCNIEMYYADGQIFLQELTEAGGVIPASTAFYAFPIKEKKEESQPEEEKQIHNIFAIVKINHCATFESHFTSFSSTSFKKIDLAPAIESRTGYYTVYEKDYMNEKELNNGWIIYSMHTEPLFINGHFYDTKTVAVEKTAIQEIIFVKDDFNIVVDILKDLTERAERAAIDIHSSYPTGSMIKKDENEYKDTYYLSLMDLEVDEYIKHFEPESIDFINLKRKDPEHEDAECFFIVEKVAQAWRHKWFKISFGTPEIAEKYVQNNNFVTINAVNLKYDKVITLNIKAECPYNIKETKEKENMSTVMVDNLYKKEHEVKNLLKNTGISIEFKPGKISYNTDIKDIKFNGPATIVFWNDGSKTVVKKGSGETTDDRKKAIIMAFLKKNKEDYKIIENTFNSEDPELALAISLLKRKGYSKDMLNKIYNKYKPKEEVKPKRKNTGKKEKTNGGSVKKRNKKS